MWQYTDRGEHVGLGHGYDWLMVGQLDAHVLRSLVA